MGSVKPPGAQGLVGLKFRSIPDKSMFVPSNLDFEVAHEILIMFGGTVAARVKNIVSLARVPLCSYFSGLLTLVFLTYYKKIQETHMSTFPDVPVVPFKAPLFLILSGHRHLPHGAYKKDGM